MALWPCGPVRGLHGVLASHSHSLPLRWRTADLTSGSVAYMGKLKRALRSHRFIAYAIGLVGD